MTKEEVDEHFAKIDAMTYERMAYLLRFAPSGHIYFDMTKPFHKVFMAKFSNFGGWTPALSKKIGHSP